MPTRSASTHLSSDQRPRNRRFVWTMLFVLTGFLLAFVAYRWWHLIWQAVLVVVCAGAR